MPVNEMQITYCAANQEDISKIFAMAKDLIDTYEDLASIEYDEVLQWVHRKIAQNITDYQCILLNGTKVGYFRLIADDGQTELDDLYIQPEFQRQGIGAEVISRCVEQTTVPIFLYVFRTNSGAIKLYERMGFYIAEEVGNTRFIMRREVDRLC